MDRITKAREEGFIIGRKRYKDCKPRHDKFAVRKYKAHEERMAFLDGVNEGYEFEQENDFTVKDRDYED